MFDIPGVRPPTQARSRETYDALLAAGRKLLNDRPFSSVTVQDIVDEAGSSAGSFYARFDDKVAFLCAIQHQVNREIQQALIDFPDTPRHSISLRSMARAVTLGLVENHTSDRGLARAMLTEARDEPRLAAAGVDLMDEVSQLMAPLLKPCELTIKEIEGRLTDAQLVVMAVLHMSLFDGGLGRSAMPGIYDDGRLVDVFIAATGIV